MYFFADFEVASQDILEQVGQEAASKDAEKDAKSEVLEYRDRFIIIYFYPIDLKTSKSCFNNLKKGNGLCEIGSFPIIRHLFGKAREKKFALFNW